MQTPPVDWLPPVLMLVGGLVVGLVLAFILSKRAKSGDAAGLDPSETPDLEDDSQLELRDLDAKKEALLSQLREIDDTASKRDEEQLAVERYEIELKTAEVLRGMDRLSGVAPTMTEPGEARPVVETTDDEELAAGPGGGMKGFVWGVASMAAIGALVIFVSDSASKRVEGGSVTGGLPMSGSEAQSAQPAADPALQRAIAAVEAAPDDLQARINLSYEYLVREDLMNVFEHTQFVLQAQPDNPQALMYQAIVRLAMGQDAIATQMLEQATAGDPDSLDARVYLALVYSEAGRFDEALAQVDEAKLRHPDQSARLSDIVGEIELRQASGVTPKPEPASDDPHSGIGLPPVGTAAAAPSTSMSPSAAVQGGVTGTISLADGVTVDVGLPVFLIVREAGADGGVPVAVSRLVASSFPMRFTLSAANSMMGDELPARMQIEARVDTDGNAMSRDQGAPEGVAEDVAIGTGNVQITLR